MEEIDILIMIVFDLKNPIILISSHIRRYKLLFMSDHTFINKYANFNVSVHFLTLLLSYLYYYYFYFELCFINTL